MHLATEMTQSNTNYLLRSSATIFAKVLLGSLCSSDIKIYKKQYFLQLPLGLVFNV